MFSDPQTSDDKKTLAYLKEDLGLGEMRIFSIALFSYKLLDYKIVDVRTTDFATEIVVNNKLSNYDI